MPKWVDCNTYYDKVDDFQELINGTGSPLIGRPLIVRNSL